MVRSTPLVLALSLLAPKLISALALQARQSVDCDFSTAANTGDTCSSFAGEWGLTVSGFEAINPGITCPNLVDGQNYCVIGEASTATTTSTPAAPQPTTKSTTSTTPTKTSTTPTAPTATSASLPSPTQSGLAANCNSFHLVASGDSCSALETQYHIPASAFLSWNPSIDTNCDNLFLGYYVCVDVVGYTATTSKTATTTKPPTTTNPTVSGPSPQMPSIVSSCNKYYQVASGDGCYSIEQSQKISSANFLAWNGAIDANCDNLWLGYYVCVGAVGTTPTKPTPTTTATPTGPSPQMPNITSSCTKYHQVVSGDSCYSIEQAADISSSNFLSWNPSVDINCDNLWLGYYVCTCV